MSDKELDTLLDACLDGRLTEEEAAQLSAQIEASPEARARYWDLAMVHGLLEHSLQHASLKVVTGEAPAPIAPSRWGGRFHWNPATSAVAGLLFGIFSATMVLAYASPFSKFASRGKTEILQESFEESNLAASGRFPKTAGVWEGDIVAPLVPAPGLEPKHGKGVAKLIPAGSRKYSYAWYILNLEDEIPRTEGLARELEVWASFAAVEPGTPARYQIRLAALNESPNEVRPIWNKSAVLEDVVLQHVGLNHQTGVEDKGWHRLRTRLELPPEARSVVISLGVSTVETDQPKAEHYLDRVRAFLIDTPLYED